eukprot:SRR837773.6898.p1 GENE.SRR837773.6898~~SRR837773.6898.p1  ORF type:complete len:142 (-),score=30.04 SRR837773.6898:50-475(-)
MLHLRRKWLGGELGGSFASKMNTFTCFMLLWVGWVGLSSWRILRFREDWGSEPMIVQGLCIFFLVVGVTMSTLHMKMVSVRFIREQAELAAAQAALRTSCRNSELSNEKSSGGHPGTSGADKSADRSADRSHEAEAQPNQA